MKTLVVTSEPFIGSAEASALTGFPTESTSVSYVTQADKLTPDVLPQSEYDIVAYTSKSSAAPRPELLAQLLATLLPGGRLLVAGRNQLVDGELQKQLVLAGFVDCSTPAGGGSVEAKKPTWQSGTKASITLKPKAKQAEAGAEGLQKKSWLLPADGDDELMDDDELLTEEDRIRPAAPVDCGVSTTKKACKNCTCGRAEGKIEKVELTPSMLENPQSGCGSCGLGDAFRCASCPYRGLPQFEMGKKIELPSDFLTADA